VGWMETTFLLFIFNWKNGGNKWMLIKGIYRKANAWRSGVRGR
jgi:hypothetical protein